MVDHPGLADPWLADDVDDVAVAGAGVVEERRQGGQFGRAPDEWNVEVPTRRAEVVVSVTSLRPDEGLRGSARSCP